jgi:Sulfotransferase family
MTVSSEPVAGTATRVPDFFIAGHAKCGTTALYAMLRRHPQIYLPSLKEPRWFATDLRYPDPPRHSRLPESYEEYLALFEQARSDQRVGDASPMYLWSREAAANIAEVQPDARIIAILREPASFLHSLHNHWVLHHVETEKDFAKAISLEEIRRTGRHVPRYSYWPQALLYSDHVRYVEQLRRYESLFSRGQMLVLIYDDFRRENEATVREVLRFLDVDDEAPVHVMEANTTKKRVRAMRADALIRGVYTGRNPLARAAKTGLKALTTERVRTRTLPSLRRRLVYGEPRAADPRFALELRRRFKGEVLALSEYLDRDLVSLWGYDELD